MKKLRKMMALVIVAVMTMMYTVPSMAASITLSSNDTHSYKVFQVLTGTLSEAGSTQLGNPAWGLDAIASPGDVNVFIESITADGLSEAEVAAKVAEKANLTGEGRGTITGGQSINSLATGYYVLVDQTTLNEYGSDPKKIDTKSLNVVKVLNDVTTVNVKYGTTEDKKTITADTLGKDSGENSYNPGKDKDNVSVGDTVKYNISAKVPANADKFKEGTFFFVITDKLSDGLTFSEGSIEVYDGETKLTEDKYTVKYKPNTSDNNTFEIALIDAASYKGNTINVKYSAVLNQNAVIGEAGNPNTSTVKFSNDPNKIYDGSPRDTTYPGFPDSSKGVPTGVTPESKTITYTTGIEIQKVDQDGKVLEGATFEISGQNTKTVLTVKETFTKDNANGDYYKLKDGKYTKTPPTTEEAMVLTPGATKGYVVDSVNGTKEVNGTLYREYVPETDSTLDVYVLNETNTDLYDGTDKYTKSTTKTPVNATSDHKASKAVDENGLVRFDGLGSGTYTIKETVTPGGYNTASDITATVTFTEGGTPVWSFSGGEGTYDEQEGIYKITIENNKGQTLPETGGIGTTIFYVVGALLVLGAGVLLVTRRRARANEQ